jgi:hypothetical protein
MLAMEAMMLRSITWIKIESQSEIDQRSEMPRPLRRRGSDSLLAGEQPAAKNGGDLDQAAIGLLTGAPGKRHYCSYGSRC